MKQQKDFNKEKLELEEILIRDRRFLSNHTNEEFVEYELTRIEGMTRKFLIKFLKKYGYIKSNTGSIKLDDKESIINFYSEIANKTI